MHLKSNVKPPPFEADAHRDLRLDAGRGVALLFVFVDHVPNNIASWLTLRNYGFSDATEVFVFISGYTCMIAYSEVLRRQGWLAMILHALGRSWEIYAAFLLTLIAYLMLIQSLGNTRYLDETNTAVFFEHPGAAVLHAGLMQYKPVNTDILPLFVLLHLIFPVAIWLFRCTNAWIALITSTLLYIAVQISGINLPGWPRGEWYFNPLAWQLLFVIGMCCANTESKTLHILFRSRVALLFAMLYLTFSLIVALGWQVKALNGFLPDPVSKVIYPIDKSNLDPLRLLHFLALMLVLVRLMPKDRTRLCSRSWTAIIRCGENSLAIYCLSVLLSFLGHVALERLMGGVLAQIAISMAGIAFLAVAATLMTWAAKLRSRRPPLF